MAKLGPIRGLLPANNLSDLTAATTARGSSGLNIESATSHGDSAYTILSTDRVVYTSAAFTAARTWTLPAASALNPGQSLVVVDAQGTLTAANTLSVARAGSDTINGGSASLVLGNAYASVTLYSDGVSKWLTKDFLPSCVLGGGSEQSVPNSTDTKLTVWSRTSAGSYDPYSMYSSGNVTLPIAGIYDISAICAFDNNPNTTVIRFFVNGAQYNTKQYKINGQNCVQASISLRLAANDVLAIYIWHNQGGAITFYGTDNSASFSVRYRSAN